MAALLSVEDALKKVLASVAAPTAMETVAVGDAIGRTLAEDVVALRTQPPFDNSAMDGYAVVSADARAGAKLAVIGESAAGRAFEGKLGPGQAVRIFTGAPMPEGADAVLMQEDAERQANVLLCRVAVAPAGKRPLRRHRFSRGRRSAQRGNPPELPATSRLAAAANHATLRVRRAPKVAVLATGDELVPPGAPIAPAQIVASNNFVIKGIVAAAGGVAVDLGIAPDNREKLAAAMARGAGADVLVTLGGASVGDYDLVQEVLKGQGLALDFWRIAMRPGKPLMLGRLNDQIVLGLPGNPGVVVRLRSVVSAAAAAGPAWRPRRRRRPERAGVSWAPMRRRTGRGRTTFACASAGERTARLRRSPRAIRIPRWSA